MKTKKQIKECLKSIRREMDIEDEKEKHGANKVREIDKYSELWGKRWALGYVLNEQLDAEQMKIFIGALESTMLECCKPKGKEERKQTTRSKK